MYSTEVSLTMESSITDEGTLHGCRASKNTTIQKMYSISNRVFLYAIPTPINPRNQKRPKIVKIVQNKISQSRPSSSLRAENVRLITENIFSRKFEATMCKALVIRVW